MIKAVQVVNDAVWCYCAPLTQNTIIYNDEDMKEDNESWYLLDRSSDLCYGYTLSMLADVLEDTYNLNQK